MYGCAELWPNCYRDSQSSVYNVISCILNLYQEAVVGIINDIFDSTGSKFRLSYWSYLHQTDKTANIHHMFYLQDLYFTAVGHLWWENV